MNDLTGAERFLAIVNAELAEHSIRWCTGCKRRKSHTRGFATWQPDGLLAAPPTVHFSRKCATRATLFTMLHEMGHLLRNTKGMKRWERESSATQFAIERMKAHGVPIPRKTLKEYREYEQRMKEWGENVTAGRRKAQ